jgi:hypothetical protein
MSNEGSFSIEFVIGTFFLLGRSVQILVYPRIIKGFLIYVQGFGCELLL